MTPKSDAESTPRSDEELKLHVDLFRFYLGLLLQTVTLALGATSGVVAYLLKGPAEMKGWLLAVALLPPAALCLGLGIGFLRQRASAAELRARLIQLARESGFGLAPHGTILVNALAGLGVLLALVGSGLLILAVVLEAR